MVFPQEFQRDESAELRVFGLADNSHRAATELLEDAIVAGSPAEE
jgi:hypothetical protein